MRGAKSVIHRRDYLRNASWLRSEDRRGELLRGAKLNVDAKRQRNELNNLANRVTTIDANGVGQSNDLAKPVHALSMKLFRTYAGEDPCNGVAAHAYSSGRTPT